MSPTMEDVKTYWNNHVHDAGISKNPVGSPEFFKDLDGYHFEKLGHLPAIVRYHRFRGMRVLDVGCGAGVDLARFAAAGADATGIDISEKSVRLAERHLRDRGLRARLLVMDGEHLDFPDESFDFVFAHGVVQYTVNPGTMIHEIHRVLKKGGEAIFQFYNRRSWLPAVSRFTKTNLEHAGAPVMKMFSIDECRKSLKEFSGVELILERFPVKTRLHKGVKAFLYNQIFVRSFQMIPTILVRRFGWHIIARAFK